MKQKLLITSILFIIFSNVKSQNCDIQIQILEDRFMFGKAEKMAPTEVVKKTQVNFTDEYMEVVLPVENQNYLIKVVNENCQAYCTRAKRVRQLHSGDEKLVRNLLKDKYEEIVAQLNQCE